MAGPQPYASGNTGTLADVVESGPDLRPVRPAGAGSFAPAASTGELFDAYRTDSRAYRTDFDLIMLRDGYAPIIDALGLPASENPAIFYDHDPATQARFGSMGQPSRLASEAQQGEQLPLSSRRLATRGLQEQLVADRVRAARAKDPGALPGIPDTVEGLRAYFREQEANKRAAAGRTIARGPGGVGQLLTGLAGGGFEAFHDPFNIATLPIGGGGRTFLQVVGRETLLNGVLEAVTLPSSAANLEQLGEELTAGQAIQDVATAGLFGGLLEGAIHLGRTHVPPALFQVMPESVQRRWADKMKVGDGPEAPLLKDVLGDMDNRELGAFAKATIGDRMTPEERAAVNSLEREQELGEASPFMAGPAGGSAHDLSLAKALQSIIDGVEPPTSRGSLLAGSSLTEPRPAAPAPAAAGLSGGGRVTAPDVQGDLAFLKAQGLPDHIAHGVVAGVIAESRGNHQIVNPTSGAFGLGQWLGPRKRELFKRYGSNPSRQQQLEFLAWELKGGDFGGKHVLAAKDPASALDAYIRKFMRPAAGAETIGDLERGMAALGRGGDMPDAGGAAPAAAADTGDVLPSALRQAADDAEAEALALSRDAGAVDLDLGRAAGLEADMLPILRRELFDNDGDWFDAQLGFYRSQGLLDDDAVGPASGPAAREVAPGAGRAESAPDGQPEAISVESYVDAYLRGEGRGDSPRDREMLQFAVSHGPEIEAEFARRADPARALTRDEIEGMRPADKSGDPLWLAGLEAVVEREAGREPKGLWGLRDKRTGELVSWAVKRKAIEEKKGDYWEPDQLDVELLDPGNVAMELRHRAALQQAAAAAVDVDLRAPELDLFNEPGGEGRKGQVESLAHDARMDLEAEVSAEQLRARNRERPRVQGLKGAPARPIASFRHDPAAAKAKGQRKRSYYLPITEHADHPAAKAGDLEAAERLVDDLVDPATIARVGRELAGARFVPVIAEEAGGRNAIPATMAHRYAAAAGGSVDRDIVQAVRAYHTGAAPAERLVRRALFDGPVIPGERYVIVDDVAVLGGTVAELADHIQRGGGKVERVVLLASGSDELAPTAKQIRTIEEEGYGVHVREIAGIEPQALTRAEAEWVLSTRSPDRLRARLVEAVGGRDAGRARPAGGGEESESGLSGRKTYRLNEDGPEQTLEEILDELDAEQAAIDALRGCATPGGGE